MRETWARGAALGTAVLITGAAALLAGLQPAPAATVGSTPGASGYDGVTLSGEVTSDPTIVRYGGSAFYQPPAPVLSDTLIALGKVVYAEEGCAACHSISGVGGRRSALDGVGTRLSREDILLWIVDPQAIRPGVRKPSYDDLGADRLEGLVTYMESLTAAGR